MMHIPAQGEPGIWPEYGPDPEQVRSWISAFDRLIDIVRKDRPPSSAPNSADRLAEQGNQVLAWVHELDEDGWPSSIHHADLHPHNAVITAGGETFI